MITRNRLLAGLNELTFVEEGMTTFFTNFAKELVKFTEGVDDEKKKEMVKLLERLHRDSARHKEMVDELTREVERSLRDEY
jgi:hypothetical protein